MNKLSMLLLAAALMTSTATHSLAATQAVAVTIPDEGYNYGYAAGQRYLTYTTDMARIADEWHKALRNVDFYNNAGETGRAEWWQGYADGLQYFDNNTY
ncbi:hypothetical protein [Hymenobacter ruber]